MLRAAFLCKSELVGDGAEALVNNVKACVQFTFADFTDYGAECELVHNITSGKMKNGTNRNPSACTAVILISCNPVTDYPEIGVRQYKPGEYIVPVPRIVDVVVLTVRVLSAIAVCPFRINFYQYNIVSNVCQYIF